jgi:hypothetical protein
LPRIISSIASETTENFDNPIPTAALLLKPKYAPPGALSFRIASCFQAAGYPLSLPLAENRTFVLAWVKPARYQKDVIKIVIY